MDDNELDPFAELPKEDEPADDMEDPLLAPKPPIIDEEDDHDSLDDAINKEEEEDDAEYDDLLDDVDNT